MYIYAAPVCFKTNNCEGESVNSDNSLSLKQCCFELSGVSFASPQQCMVCPKTGTYIRMYAMQTLSSKGWLCAYVCVCL